MNEGIEITRDDLNDALGERITEALNRLSGAVEEEFGDRSEVPIPIHVHESIEECTLLAESQNPPRFLEEDGVAALAHEEEDGETIILTKSGLAGSFGTDEGTVAGVLAHEVGHVLRGDIVDQFPPDTGKRIADVCKDAEGNIPQKAKEAAIPWETMGYSAPMVRKVLKEICQEVTADQIASRLGFAEELTRVRSGEIDRLEEDPFERAQFIRLLEFPAYCLTIAEFHPPAAEVAKRFWEHGRSSPKVAENTRPIAFYRDFVEDLVDQRLYERPEELLEFTLERMDGAHFF